MKCADVERVLPELLDGAPDLAFQTDFETHIKSCPACADLISDLNLISSEARQLSAIEEEPPARVWMRIAAELRAEGLIHDEESHQESAPIRPALVPTSPRRWGAWWLAPVAAALLAAGAYVVSHKTAPTVAQHTPAPPATTSNSIPETAAVPSPSVPTVAPPVPALVAEQPAPSKAPQLLAQKGAKHVTVPEVEAGANEEDQQFLSVVSTLSPSMRVTYESQLRAVNADIRETEAYVKRNPGDADARQHLMDAFREKALLYQIALDRIQ